MLPLARPAVRSPLLAVIGVAWLAVVIGGRVVVPELIASAYDGQSFGWLDQKIANHKAYRAGVGLDASRDWYLDWAHGYALKSAALATLFAAGAATLIASNAARRRVRRFFLASSAPLNLAVLRIVAFGMLLYLLRSERILYYAAWPREMYEFPALAGLFYRWLPITVEVAQPLLYVGLVTTSLAIAGLFTRTSAAVSVLLGYYLIGIPQLSGKVNHLHHVLVICAVLACSRCGDAVSFDAVWRAIGRADRGEVAPIRRRVRYGLPIRVAMMALAVFYFFPGFWKIASNGPQWVFSNNLENHMLQKWFELEHYTPPIPLHEMPFSGPGGALFAVMMELGFPLALLWRPTRVAWAAMGLAFHNLTNLLMNISFVTLQAMYVVFVDWQRLLRWVGRRAFGEPIRVLYDGNCGLCRRTMAVLGVLDWLEQLRPVNAIDRQAVEREGLGYLEDAALMADMHAAWRLKPEERADVAEVARIAEEWGVAKGYDAYQAIAWRVPLLWLALPLVHLPPIVMVGKRVYRRVADSRACRVPVAPKTGDRPAIRTTPSWSPVGMTVVASALLGGTCLMGAARLHKAWPIACYPLFDQIEVRTVVWPEFTVTDAAGVQTSLDDDPIRDRLGPARYVASMDALVSTPLDEAAAIRTLQQFVAAWREAGVLPTNHEQIERLDVVRATYELSGPRRPKAPIEVEPHFSAAWGDLVSPTNGRLAATD